MARKREERLKVFGQRLNTLRGDMTQAAFAEKIGISDTSIGQYECFKRLPDAGILKKICVACGVTADYLLGLSRAAAPDDFIQAVVTRYGLNEQALQFLERLNAQLDIDDAEKSRISAKQIAFENAENLTVTYERESNENELESPGLKLALTPALTKKELTSLFAIMQDEINKQALIILNKLLTVSTGREWETYGSLILTAIYNYCCREYFDIEQIRYGVTGRTLNTLTSENQRNNELYTLNNILKDFRNKLSEG
ncbi:MAG: helix-turn-helix domain-containing protein [Synergistaceae bacterium]|nr:helix-turn-helix domain-containing protein [Synergistaceae bacterium]